MVNLKNAYVRQYYSAFCLKNQMKKYFATRYHPHELDHLNLKLDWDMKIAKEMLEGSEDEIK